MKARKIYSKFVISEGENLAGVEFRTGNKIIMWENLTYKEQVKTLNAWINMYQLFGRFLKEEEK